MIGEVRFEFIKRLMGFLIRVSSGERYVEKLETSYKTNLLFIFFLVLTLIGIGSKYIQLYSFTNDATIEYTRLLAKEEELHIETQKAAQFARMQFKRAQSYEREIIELQKKVNMLTIENKNLKDENDKLLNKK